ncbi:MAG: response regulator, partial [Deltaproteobacteria bacterium]|nr:response regulator [Deltaproteobacteria bacterium]
HDSDLVIEFANLPVCELWGRAHADVIGHPLLDVMPELRDQVFAELLHGGRVEAHSAGRHRGSEFVVWLPAMTVVAGAAAEEAGRTPPLDEARAVVRRVLVVDDNQDAAELLAELLSLSGCTTRVAHDGPTGLVLARDLDPEVALLDLGLPGMDGFELAKRLRAQQPRVRIIAITGYGQASDRERSRSAGFDAHLVKPVNLEELSSLIAQLTTP